MISVKRHKSGINQEVFKPVRENNLKAVLIQMAGRQIEQELVTTKDEQSERIFQCR